MRGRSGKRAEGDGRRSAWGAGVRRHGVPGQGEGVHARAVRGQEVRDEVEAAGKRRGREEEVAGVGAGRGMKRGCAGAC